MSTFTPYTGVGSRSTPQPICDLFTMIARSLNVANYGLRSGGAPGADVAFERGAVPGRCVVYTMDRYDATRYTHHMYGPSFPRWQEALDMARDIHPAWDRCSQFVRGLHARNIFQVLGFNLDAPSAFTICWTPNGRDVGGTRTAIICSRMHSIPVFNFGDPNKRDLFEDYCLTRNIPIDTWKGAPS